MQIVTMPTRCPSSATICAKLRERIAFSGGAYGSTTPRSLAARLERVLPADRTPIKTWSRRDTECDDSGRTQHALRVSTGLALAAWLCAPKASPTERTWANRWPTTRRSTSALTVPCAWKRLVTRLLGSHELSRSSNCCTTSPRAPLRRARTSL